MDSRTRLSSAIALCTIWLFSSLLYTTGLHAQDAPPATSAKDERPNILLITADDLNCDSVGAFGAKVADTTPNIDALAETGMRFERAHVTIAVCQPCRSVWLTGRYPHRSGGEGFHRLTKKDVPILPDLLRRAGYRVGILGKVRHSTPHASFEWDSAFDRKDLGDGRSPRKYAARAKEFFTAAKVARKPFFYMVNTHDPHRPFHGNDRRIDYAEGQAEQPSRRFRPAEVHVPGFLPDLPPIRRELAEYFSSVRRCDDFVGAVLGALDETRLAQNTVVVFLSDHGMPLPFAKTNCYPQSTRTPLIVRWHERVEPKSVDRRHFVGGVDLAPTLLEIARVEFPGGIDGRSFLPLLRGESQDGRDAVFTQFFMTSAKRRFPMRAVLTADYAYILNPWADGTTTFRNESMAGRSMKAMRRAAEDDAAIAARVDLFLHRVPEEVYDLRRDPDCLVNLVDDPEHADTRRLLGARLRHWMKEYEDPLLDDAKKR